MCQFVSSVCQVCVKCVSSVCQECVKCVQCVSDEFQVCVKCVKFVKHGTSMSSVFHV